MGGLEDPLIVWDWELYRGGRPDGGLIRRLCEKVALGGDILIITGRGELEASEMLLRDGIPYTALLSKPPSYDERWYDKVREVLRKWTDRGAGGQP